MSDYLWDRSGEPDAEVKRLEELLGRLRQAPRPFELPAETGTHARLVGRAGLSTRVTLSSPARLAIAATLLLAVLAGALVLLRHPSKEGGGESASSTRSAPASPAPSATHEEVRREAEQRRESVALQAHAKPPEREAVSREAASNVRRGREVSGPRVASASVAEGGAFDIESRMRAKEQLVEAMRLTSEALKEVRSRASGADTNANSFDGRNPLK
jgi:hypothetical protein